MEVERESTRGPNWLDLPIDLTANILHRLGAFEIVTSACECVRNGGTFICCKAVERSCDHLEDIDIETFGNDDLLECIAKNGSHLHSMRLVDCYTISDKQFSEVARRFPQLEKVDISLCCITSVSLEVLGRSCPLLKSLEFGKSKSLVKSRFVYCESDDRVALVIAETMSCLCHLGLSGHELTNVGLHAILVKCPLESLKKRCIDQINDLQLPVPCYDDYIWMDFDPSRALIFDPSDSSDFDP
ncbi:F-box/LRR protein, putative [Medicago truncatula]|uniref:F-box/LRR protein, putative n=1 Tax=Medicago truncatula TaxID=3880 RepID=G7J788_MEDTR|nr:F-box/LRR protein, putative [Medicago truncatula]